MNSTIVQALEAAFPDETEVDRLTREIASLHGQLRTQLDPEMARDLEERLKDLHDVLQYEARLSQGSFDDFVNDGEFS